ncbi:hypothetical protein SAMN05444287_1728 [Octadecabacter temperatus]|uniref:Uncharacterized protein n=1 Tax=Octadecabacter temperatus TaxID=1458307 RepID=A0A0K0Y6T8_9RHOB|nr:hypothetical protein [Octadecabacter temperatus]AKS46611.1 hypothetical protein OSB_20720 [Octadecabacter temperatus]SIO17723.1 hypothetical protein SAMN05444287_1728 [Octadecabacter temperatus]
MKYAVLLLAGFALAGCDGQNGQTLPDGVTAADVALFRAAVADAGCSITSDAQAAPVEARTGFSEDKLRSITQYLRLNGETDVGATGFRLTSGTCANA